jgi:hypothetical protein
MRNLALADITPEHLRQMRGENETLFVEFKSSLDGEGYKVAEAVASFANTLGGWVLVGLSDDGQPSGWTPPSNLTDRLRQILDRWVDPLPAFAALLVEHDGIPIGLVRVYESTDTPHVLKNGKVVVRSVAESRNRARVYRPGGVDTQIVLRELAGRGRRAVEDATKKLNATFLVQSAIGMDPTLGGRMKNCVALRAVPLVGESLRDLAVSTTGRELLDATVLSVAGIQGVEPSRRSAASGLISEINARFQLVDGVPHVPRSVLAVADAAGVIAVAFKMHLTTSLRPGGVVVSTSDRPPALTLTQFRDGIIAPVLRGAVTFLTRAELYGRSVLELRIGDLQTALRFDPENGDPGIFPPNLPLGGEIALPLAANAPEVETLADRWRDDLGRALGLETLRP